MKAHLGQHHLACHSRRYGADMTKATAKRGKTQDSVNPLGKTDAAHQQGVKNQESFPFLVGTQKLNRPFQVGGSCGLSRTAKAGGEGGSGGGTNGRGVASGSDNANGPF